MIGKCQCGKQLQKSSYVKVIGASAPILTNCIKCPDEYGCGYAVFLDSFVNWEKINRNVIAMSSLRHSGNIRLGDIP